MAFSFKRTGDDDYPRFIKAVVQGAPKSGKTTFLSTFPNIVIADVEHEQGGLMSIAHKNVPYVEIDSSQTLRTLKTILGDASLRAKAAQQLGMPKIESVAIDTLDEYQRILKAERLARTKAREFKRDDWGWLLEEMRSIINGFVALPLNVVFTVHTKLSVVDEDTSIMVPALQGAIGDELPGMVGFALETVKRAGIDNKGNTFTAYSLQAEGDEKSPHLGNRAGGRLPRMIPADFEVLHKAVYDGLAMAKTTSVEFDSGQTSVQSSAAPAPASAPEAPAPAEAPATQTDVQAPAPADTSEPPPAGAPAADAEEKISKAALDHLKGMYVEFDLALPPAANDWTMAKGRDVARWIVAVKADMRSGTLDKEAATREIVEGLKGMDAWVDPSSPEVSEQPPNEAGYTGTVKDTIAEIVDWVGPSDSRASAALKAEYAKGDKARSSLVDKLKKHLEDSNAPLPEAPAAKAEEATPTEEAPEPPQEPQTPVETPEAPEPTPEPAAAPEPAPEPAAEEAAPEPEAESNGEAQLTEEQQEAIIKEELGGERVPDDELEPGDRPCAVCGKPSDDVELSELAEARYGEWLCVEDYIEKNKARKEAAKAAATS